MTRDLKQAKENYTNMPQPWKHDTAMETWHQKDSSKVYHSAEKDTPILNIM